MRSLAASLLLPILLMAAFWLAFGACVDTEIEPSPPGTRVLVAWPPLACPDDHRVAIALAAVDDAARVERSVPCTIGWLALDVPHPGDYHARIEADAAPPGPPVLVAERDLDLESTIVRWTLDAPP